MKNATKTPRLAPQIPAKNDRKVRVAARIQQELSDLIAREVRDPRVLGVSITEVRVTADLQDARVHVRGITGGEDQAAMLRGLESASGLLRRGLGARMALRNAPRLHFHWDDGVEKRGRIDALLREIDLEPRAIEESPVEDDLASEKTPRNPSDDDVGVESKG